MQVCKQGGAERMGCMNKEDAKEVAAILAKEAGSGLKWLLVSVGAGGGLLLVLFGISLVKWW